MTFIEAMYRKLLKEMCTKLRDLEEDDWHEFTYVCTARKLKIDGKRFSPAEIHFYSEDDDTVKVLIGQPEDFEDGDPPYTRILHPEEIYVQLRK